MLNHSWEAKIKRADELAAKGDATSGLLTFYGGLLRAQKRIYEELRSRRGWLPSGRFQEDLPVIRPLLAGLLKAVERMGPPLLVEEARSLLEASDSELDRILVEQWREPSNLDFFSKSFLQPYTRWLAESERPIDRHLDRRENLCPVCAGRPQVSCLLVKESSSDGGNRDLICSTCLTVWPFKRVLCANCGEERPSKLGYFQSPQYDYARIEACDSCGYYIKGIDLTRYGLAVPLVDEVASAPLDLWARDRGYKKIELNLVGL